ncbi:carbohydrate ABC transporter permease [Anaeromyxobacter dehalogenans]|uniref:carbohydrate ABC transporter permease n=1 Tax=Anaeromyxobacter dehalogenans TaxID=161493 RepID=UPI0002F2C9B7|nr:sugar ABC transporter permease [Anaeromyxobacter dehalogenans]
MTPADAARRPAAKALRDVPRRRGPSSATWLGVAMFSPAVIYILALVGLPLVLAFLYSVSDVTVGSEGWRFVGLDNFRSVMRSPAFRRSLLDSFVFTISTQVIVLVCATALSLALKERFRGRAAVRFLILLPWVAPISLGAIGWKWLLDSIYSVVSWVLARLHLVNAFDPPMWLGEPTLAMGSVIAVHSWRMIPFATVIMLAGLTSIPKEIPEAAAVDGAGFWRTHFEITLPMMRPIINVAVLFGVVFTFTDMTVVYILTRGGPYDTTQVLPSLAFFTGVLGSDLAEGAAISVFLVPILVAVAFLMLRVAHRAEVT